jgi:hypothetical protein
MSNVIEFPPPPSLLHLREQHYQRIDSFNAHQQVKRRARKWFRACMRFAVAMSLARKRGDFRNVDKYAARLEKAAVRYDKLMTSLYRMTEQCVSPSSAA